MALACPWAFPHLFSLQQQSTLSLDVSLNKSNSILFFNIATSRFFSKSFGFRYPSRFSNTDNSNNLVPRRLFVHCLSSDTEEGKSTADDDTIAREYSNNDNNNKVEVEDKRNVKKLRVGEVAAAIEEAISLPPEGFIIITACAVGLLTGIGVVLFNSAVHEIRDIFWDGIPSRGASWLREAPVEKIWPRVILVPACGGLIVSLLNSIRSALETPSEGILSSNLKASLKPLLKTIAASVTLGTGNSLGPEGPSVEIGASIAKGVGYLFERNSERRLSLVAAGSAAGISSGYFLNPRFHYQEGFEFSDNIRSGVTKVIERLAPNVTFAIEATREIAQFRGKIGRFGDLTAQTAVGIMNPGFNAAVAGCFFAVESVLWPSAADSSSSLTNTTSMVILGSVIASVVSEVGLGSAPTFTVPDYDFRSPSELPLYLMLGLLCGLISLTLSKCTSYGLAAVENFHNTTGIPKAVFPVLGGLSVGLIALAYPEVLYWGFENVDILLESRPFVDGLPANLLLQLVGVKILATSLSRAFGLVGGYYAPSLFIGAATGMAYGKFASYAVSHSDPLFHLSILEVASPQAYGLVGMAATLAGVCQVPLTSVLLLFELTQDYRIVLPLLGAVGLSSWIASSQTRKTDVGVKLYSLKEKANTAYQSEYSSYSSQSSIASSSVREHPTKALYSTDLCELESSLCVDESRIDVKKLEETIFVKQAMRTRYVSVMKDTPLVEAVDLMLVEKQSCAMIVNNDNFLLGLLTLRDIQQFSNLATAKGKKAKVQKLLVSEMCHFGGKTSKIWTATPSMNLLFAQGIMNRHRVNQLPVVSEHIEEQKGGYLLGLLDRGCIHLACRAAATKEILSNSQVGPGS